MTIAAALAIGFVGPCREELIYRFGVQSLFHSRFGEGRVAELAAIGLASLVFVSVHLAPAEENAIAIVRLLPISLAIGYLASRRSLMTAAATHSFFNVLLLVGPWSW